ncbi:MAG: flagellar hook-associated protein FlgK [Desulfitobacteriia bacterium]|jgi:flagellar hook-associated protein 1 FlgK
MYSSFFGLNIASRALSTNQAGLDVTGHNIANANTKGYTRQLPNIQTGVPLTLPALGREMTLGTGSIMDNVIRARDNYIDRQFRWETSKYEYWAGREESLNMVEGVLNEPTEYSLHNDLDKFWSSWSELAKNPQNMGARAVVKERALTLVGTLNHISKQINDLRKDLDANTEVIVRQINTIAQQIKELNTQIKRAEVGRDNPNDLKDQRDALVDELSKLVPVRVVESQDPNFDDRVVGIYQVFIGDNTDPANALVNDQTVRLLEDPPPAVSLGEDEVRLPVWADSKYIDGDGNEKWEELDLGNEMGKLKANLDIRIEYLKNFNIQIDNLAKGIAAAVNALHLKGQSVEGTGDLNFFVNGTLDPADPDLAQGITAANIALNKEIFDNPNKIATGARFDSEGNIIDPVEVGDGSVAIAISSLSQGWDGLKSFLKIDEFSDTVLKELKDLGAASFGDYYGGIVSKMGVEVQQSKRMAQGQDVLVSHMGNLRESFSGVSLDEEMANLIKFQKSYSAAARIVTTIDSMLERILAMGVTK